MADEVKSGALELNKTDYKKIAKGAAIAFGAAALFSISNWLAQGQINWSTFGTMCIPAAISTGINAGLKYFQNNQG